MNTYKSTILTPPSQYFGLRSKGNIELSNVRQSFKSVDLTEEVDDDDDECETAEKWHVQSVQSIPTTTSMIAIGFTPDLEFSFVIKPSPGSKQTELVGF